MSHGKFIRNALVVVATLVMSAHVQAASLFRAYLALDGLDSNPCTVTAPCRLLPAALAAVTEGGEIWMLDSANYNATTVVITKSVTILAVPGAVGSVVSISGGSAIEASTPGTKVALRNLVIVPFPGGGGTSGISVDGAAKLTLEDSVISGHTWDGIVVFSPTSVQITNCIIRDNGIHGVELQGGSTTEISGSKFLANAQAGVVVSGTTASLTTSAAIGDSVLSANVYGLYVQASVASSNARASITRSTLSDNSNDGVHVSALSGAALATVGRNMVTGNGIGLYQSGPGTSTLESLGDNIVRQNTTPTSGTITTVPPM